MAFNKIFAAAVAGALLLTGTRPDAAQARPANYTGTIDGILAGLLGGHGGGPNGNKLPSQGYLGVMIRDISESDVTTLHLKSTRGAQVTVVDHDGPACKAGLRERDVILSLNGMAIDGEDQLRRMLHDLPPGRPVSLVIVRAGAEQTVNTTMANREELEKRAWEQHWVVPEPVNDTPVAASEPLPGSRAGLGRTFMSGGLLPLAPSYTGAKVDAMGAQLAAFFGVKDGKGLLVHDVDANSPAAQAGLRAGDVVTRINGGHVATKSEWAHILRESKGHPVSLTVVRDRQEQVLTLMVDPKHRSAIDPPPSPSPANGTWAVMLLR